jgi:hypothetical protein
MRWLMSDIGTSGHAGGLRRCPRTVAVRASNHLRPSSQGTRFSEVCAMSVLLPKADIVRAVDVPKRLMMHDSNLSLTLAM